MIKAKGFVCRCCATDTDKLTLSVSVAQQIRTNWASWPEGPKKHLFLEGFCPFFALFLASGPCICTWQGYFEKKTVLSCFFWPQGPLIQSSAAPQGSPPPTQQINIRNTNQLSWAINYLHAWSDLGRDFGLGFLGESLFPGYCNRERMVLNPDW